MTTQQVVKDMRQRISTQALLPGTRATEEDVAETYGIPRARAREALAALEDRGLIERVPNKGAVVVFIDMETTYRLYEVREALDALTVRLACEKSKPEEWRDMEELLGEPFQNSLRNGDMDEHIATIELFRERLKSAAANPELSDLIERIYDRTRVTMRRVGVLPGRAEVGIGQYRAILKALLNGNADEAEACARELNRSAREYIVRYKNYLL